MPKESDADWLVSYLWMLLVIQIDMYNAECVDILHQLSLHKSYPVSPLIGIKTDTNSIIISDTRTS